MEQIIKKEYQTEPLRLASLCLAHNIPFEIDAYCGGLIVAYPVLDPEKRISDAICHDGSYGREKGLLEMMGLTEDNDVEGWLTAEQVFEKWHKHWLKHQA